MDAGHVILLLVLGGSAVGTIIAAVNNGQTKRTLAKVQKERDALYNELDELHAEIESGRLDMKTMAARLRNRLGK